MEGAGMRFLLVNPWIHDFSAYDLWMRPLGLMLLASRLEQGGHTVALLDMLDRSLTPDIYRKGRPTGRGKYYQKELSKPAIFQHIPRKYHRFGIPEQTARDVLKQLPEPDAVLMTSGMTYWYPGVRETAEFLRMRFPDRPVILGGVYATLMPEHAAVHAGVDHVADGDIPGAFRKLCAWLGLSNSSGAAWKDLIPSHEWVRNLGSTAVETSRGCVFSCDYCSSRRLTPQFEEKSVSQIRKEFRVIHSLGIRDVAFYDDALLIRPERRIKPVLKMLSAECPGIRLHTPNGMHCDCIDRELAVLMRQAGMQTIRLSLETISGAARKCSAGKVSEQGFARAVQCLRQAGYTKKEIEVYVLLGMPGQKLDEVLETFELIARTGGYIKAAFYSPVPGSRIFRRCHSRMTEPLMHNKISWKYDSAGLSADEYDFANQRINELNFT